jgi:hypothetical protein
LATPARSRARPSPDPELWPGACLRVYRGCPSSDGGPAAVVRIEPDFVVTTRRPVKFASEPAELPRELAIPQTATRTSLTAEAPTSSALASTSAGSSSPCSRYESRNADATDCRFSIACAALSPQARHPGRLSTSATNLPPESSLGWDRVTGNR